MKNLTPDQKVSLLKDKNAESTSEKQRMLFGLLCAESVAHLTTNEKVEKCRVVLLDYINDKATWQQLNEATRECAKVAYYTVSNEYAHAEEWLRAQEPNARAAACAANLAAIGVSSGDVSGHELYKIRDRARAELFAEDGAVAALIPDFNKIPSLKQMLLNYPKALELAKEVFNKVRWQ